MDRYRSRRFKPQVDYNNYAAITSALQHDKVRSRVFGPGYQEIYAPTSGGDRPRALKAGYNFNTQSLVIIMRDKYTWIQYDNISPDMWEQLLLATSTNDYVDTVLLGWPWMEINYGNLPRTRGQHFDLGFEE